MDSLKDATSARKAHNRVVELEPGNIDAQLVQGVHDYIIGSLPFHLKILGFVAGFHGDRESGMKTLQLVATKGNANRYDAKVLLAAIYRREKKPEQALPLLNELIERFPRNFLFRLETVQMYSDLGQKEPALADLNKTEQLKRSNTSRLRGVTDRKNPVLPWQSVVLVYGSRSSAGRNEESDQRSATSRLPHCFIGMDEARPALRHEGSPE